MVGVRNGRCNTCGDVAVPGRVTCAYHIEYRRIAQERMHARRLGLPMPVYPVRTGPGTFAPGTPGAPRPKRGRARKVEPVLPLDLPRYVALRDMLGVLFVYHEDQFGIHRLTLTEEERRVLAPQLAKVTQTPVRIYPPPELLSYP